MAMNSPGSYTNLKSPKSPRQLPQLPQPISSTSGQRSPKHPLQDSSCKSPSPPRVFEFPPEYYPETPNANFDFEDFGKINSVTLSSHSSHLPESGSCSNFNRSLSFYSQNSSGIKSPRSFESSTSPVFQFCNPKKNFGKTLSYPPKSPVSPSSIGSIMRSRSPSCGSSQNFNQNSKSSVEYNRRNSCLNLRPVNSPKTIVTSSSRSPSPRAAETDCDKFYKASENTVSKKQDNDSPKNIKKRLGSFQLNKSYGCLNEVAENMSMRSSVKNISRRSTSDLIDAAAVDENETETTILSSPRRRGSMKGGLAYLASRRGSRDSQASNISNISNEDIGPLNFSAHPRGRQRRTSNFLELPVPDHIRPRVHSLPEKAYNPRAGDDLYRLRAFSITHKGVVNRGDSIISRRSRSNTSVNSSRNSNVSGERSPFEGSCCSGQGAVCDSSESEAEEGSKYRVVLLGDSGVGKTALVSQFMTSEYMNTYDASLDDEFGEKTVSILLDGEESEMIFIDHPHVEMSLENSLSTYEPHACVVVYSVVSRPSFQVAEEMLNYLWREQYTQDRSVIVVGNKSDLARSRTIDANEGKQLATSRECKFIETSSGIQHNVDELLVGILKQIRLRETRDKKLRRQGSKSKILSKLHGSKTALSLNLAREILNKMCMNDSKSKSCENLHVL
ncbi:uncharacterized protein LOC103575310 [Microplitis demolitor]|uniref:uncharacterized protein LOC103575310 n=1 Tax=Microplitis demolitor TaxID=69319 RepID=UPI0004CCB605|nr:uncharacterized protein LOC103575310 [Microplitis demolitor]